MTEKELHRLSRQDLLQLLLAQSKEVSRQRAAIEELKSNAEKDHELIDRLKGKLDDKDASLETLKHRLDEKDETIAHLKRRLDAKDETMNKLKADAEDMSGTMEFLRSRLDEKDIALDAARARLDMLSGVSAPPVRRITWEPWIFCAWNQRSRLSARLSVSSSFCVLLRPTRMRKPPLERYSRGEKLRLSSFFSLPRRR